MGTENKIVRLVPSAGKPERAVEKSETISRALEKHNKVLKLFLVRAVGSIAEAEDILQEVYLRLVRRQERETISEFPRAYLFTTATNVIRDRRRRQKVRRNFDHDPFDETSCPDHTPSVEATMIWQEGLEIVKDALQDLKPIHRRIFVLHKIEGLSFPEIAKETGVPLRTVQRYASDALAHCAARLEKQKWFKDGMEIV